MAQNKGLVNTVELGRAIRRKREELQLSLRDVADETKVSASTLSRIENGTGKPDARQRAGRRVGAGGRLLPAGVDALDRRGAPESRPQPQRGDRPRSLRTLPRRLRAVQPPRRHQRRTQQAEVARHKSRSEVT
ncbi:MAG: helix-turn-helix domain-containing protein [Acidobacteria bacterium]|nr:helix-turn-helix domain-containing protein [Acidobacteriota bacterium]